MTGVDFAATGQRLRGSLTFTGEQIERFTEAFKEAERRERAAMGQDFFERWKRGEVPILGPGMNP